MTKTICVMVALALGGPALAADKAAAPAAAPAPAAAAPAAAAPPSAPAMPDMTKAGPMSRPVTKQDKKGVDDLYKAFEEAMKKGDVNGAADLCEFPVLMITDDAKGVAKSTSVNREQWIAMFAPFMQNMPKDMKMSNKHATTFLSDTLAISIEANNMAMGKLKGKWSSMSALTLVDGKWKFRQMTEAGWGDMPPFAPAAPKHTAAAVPPPKK